jgi:pimeloyl-ACP methyl ester carboxylesterase
MIGETMRSLKITFLSLLFVLFTTSAMAQDGGAAGLIARLGGTPCPDDSAFTCVTLSVPVDHFDASNSATIDVVFGLLPATGERRGMFVTVVGGPGYSGLSVADWYSSYFDPSVLEHFDIVFFDQRGIANSQGTYCVNAVTAYDTADLMTDTPENEAAAIDAARQFVQDCTAEMEHSELLPYLGTRQAIEDLELFRQAIGDDRFYLYGESYGTQYSQTYAAAYPQHLSGLILDGVVDLTLEVQDYYVEQAQAFSDALTATLQVCNADDACADDIGGSAVSSYDLLYQHLTEQPVTTRFPLPDGSSVDRTFTATDLETVAADAVYEESARMNFVRAMGAANIHDDYVPFLRLKYQVLGVDPTTQEPIPDPTFSVAAYYAIECNDYNFFSGTPDERAEAYMRAGDAVDASIDRLSSVFYGDLPCVFWNVQGEQTRPAPLTAEGVQTFVLNSTLDPATPVQQGYDVFSRLADGYQITMQGGPHVIFGRENECPDAAITDWMVNGTLPAERETTCEGRVMSPYISLSPVTITNIEEGMNALDIELSLAADYRYWDLISVLTIGCTYGGTVDFVATEDGELWNLNDCAMFPNFTVSGTAILDYNVEQFTLNAQAVLDENAAASVTYTRAALYAGEGETITEVQ